MTAAIVFWRAASDPVAPRMAASLNALIVSTTRSPALCALFIGLVSCELPQPAYPLSPVLNVPSAITVTPKYATVDSWLKRRSALQAPEVTSPDWANPSTSGSGKDAAVAVVVADAMFRIRATFGCRRGWALAPGCTPGGGGAVVWSNAACGCTIGNVAGWRVN